jgi:hypothetical protein
MTDSNSFKVMDLIPAFMEPAPRFHGLPGEEEDKDYNGPLRPDNLYVYLERSVTG